MVGDEGEGPGRDAVPVLRKKNVRTKVSSDPATTSRASDAPLSTREATPKALARIPSPSVPTYRSNCSGETRSGPSASHRWRWWIAA